MPIIKHRCQKYPLLEDGNYLLRAGQRSQAEVGIHIVTNKDVCGSHNDNYKGEFQIHNSPINRLYEEGHFSSPGQYLQKKIYTKVDCPQ